MTRGTERDEPTPGATAVAALYEAFAQPLYRYAWSLVGSRDDIDESDDPAAASVHDALVAGTLLEEKRADPADLGPWLYALVRAACQRRGLTHTCPYSRLATVPDEAPVTHMYSRLPASHRELVELTLRHALPTAAVARILSLDPRICGELSRSAIRRAAEGLREAFGDEDEKPTWRAQLHEVSAALTLLCPPGPPPGLLERAVRTCSDPALAGERERIAAAMEPLTEEGYPVHRAPVGGAEEEEVLAPAEPAAEPLPRALPADRVTTTDHPVREEYRADLDSPHGTTEDEHGYTRRRRVLPAVSGVLTVVLAVFLWSWAGSIGAPPTVIEPGPSEGARNPLVAETEATSTAADSRPAAQPSSDSNAEETDTPGQSPEPSDEGSAPGQGRENSEHPNDPTTPGTGEDPPPPQESPSDEEEAPASPERPENEDPPGDEDEGADDGRGMFDSLFGLLFGD